MPSTNEKLQGKTAGENRLAVVTGASGGLGAEFARQLAAQGYNLILSGRRVDRMEAIARELGPLYAVQVEVKPADLAKIDELRWLEGELRHQERVDLLVNNAGYGMYGHFWESDLEAQAGMILVHDLASVRLAHAVLPGMIARRSGGIIQVASMAAFLRRRNSVMYSATKSFLVAFSQALIDDLKGTGVRVQGLCPGFIVTEFHDASQNTSFDRGRIPRLLWLNAHGVVHESLVAIGRGSGIVIPNFWYRLGAIVLNFPGIGGFLGKLAGD